MKEFIWKSRKQSFIGLLIFLLFWEIAAYKINNDIYLPKLEDILNSMAVIFQSKDFINNILSSLYRSIISYFAAIILAVILGVLSLMYPLFKNLLKPLHSITKTIPTMVLVVLTLVWFDKDKTPYIVGFAIVFPILYDGIINSINSIDNKLLEMCTIYNVSKKEKIKKIYVKAIKYYIVGALMSTFSLAFKVVVAGEVHGQPKYGIGSAVQISKVNFDTVAIFAWIIIIALLSIIFELVNKLLERKVYRWRYENGD